jgi:hypothetical protein
MLEPKRFNVREGAMLEKAQCQRRISQHDEWL